MIYMALPALMTIWAFPTISGATLGLGVGPQHIARVVGVVKAYQTRVGAGPMPTELSGDLADRMRGTGSEPWDEFGTTTDRPRRCGWLDLVALRYAQRVNGLTEMSITKLDILSRFDTLKLCTGYEIGGETIDNFPIDMGTLARCRPIYETLPGWRQDISGARDYDGLPEPARAYVTRIEQLLGIPASCISVGPGREQTIRR